MMTMLRCLQTSRRKASKIIISKTDILYELIGLDRKINLFAMLNTCLKRRPFSTFPFFPFTNYLKIKLPLKKKKKKRKKSNKTSNSLGFSFYHRNHSKCI